MKLLSIVFALLLLLSAAPAWAQTETPTDTPEPTATLTPEPTATLTPEPTATPVPYFDGVSTEQASWFLQSLFFGLEPIIALGIAFILLTAIVAFGLSILR